MSGSLNSASASGTVNQLPMRTPCRRAPLTRAIPEAISGASRPLSAASAARRRMAVMRKFTVEGGQAGFDQFMPLFHHAALSENHILSAQPALVFYYLAPRGAIKTAKTRFHATRSTLLRARVTHRQASPRAELLARAEKRRATLTRGGWCRENPPFAFSKTLLPEVLDASPVQKLTVLNSLGG